MTQSSKRFSQRDHQQVTRAVESAEANTTAEIVPVVALSSGRYDRGEDIVGLWSGLIALGIAWSVVPVAPSESGTWGGLHPVVQLAILVAALLIGFIAGAVLANRVTWLRALFTPKAQMVEEVRKCAQSAFYDRRVHHTAEGTGLLIYVSLFEHQAVITADQVVLEKLGQPALDAICLRLTSDLRTGTITDALCHAIAAAGEKLSVALPSVDSTVNALSDALVVLD